MIQQIEIVYQHKDFIVINKPIGLSVHRDDNEIGLTTIIANQLNLSRVWLVHRLDKNTSGLLILALNAGAAKTLSNLFFAHLIQKTYIALSVHKPKKKQGIVIGDMQKARRSAWKLCPTKENPAITRFKSISCEANLRLFILSPKTGKTHQLRVMMKSLGSPILGDEVYGGNKEKSDRIYLHAYCLNFYYDNELITIKSSPKMGIYFKRESVLDKLNTLDIANL